MLLALLLAAALLKLPPIAAALQSLNAVGRRAERRHAGRTSFVFGYLGGAQPPFTATHPQSSFILAFQALPLVLVISALSALLFHWRLMPLVVHAFAWLLRRTLGVGGAVGVSAAANVFVGMVEAPLVSRPTWRACRAANCSS